MVPRKKRPLEANSLKYEESTNHDQGSREKAIRSLSKPSRFVLPEKFHLGALLTVCLLVFFLNLGACHLWDEDEPRNAGCTTEMMQRGDWIVPTFNDQLRPQKPILIYWLMMFSYQVIGSNEWGARFWSAVFGAGTVLLTYRIGKRMFCPSIGFWASLVLSTNIMFTVASRAATPDALLIFFSTLTIYLFVHQIFQPFDPDRLTTFDWNRKRFFPAFKGATPIFIAMSFGVLAKGPIAVLLPCMVLGLFQLIIKSKIANSKPAPSLNTSSNSVENPQSGNFDVYSPPEHHPKLPEKKLGTILGVIHPGRFLTTLWEMNPLAIIAFVLLIAGPWYFLVGWYTDWEFLRIFFLRENIERATTEMENHSGGFWFHPAAIQVVFFPWSLITVPVLLAFWKILKQPERFSIWYPGIILVSVWIGLQIGVFSIVQTKLPSYVTPCYPAISLLWGIYLHRVSRGEKFHPFWLLPGVFGLMAAVGICLIVGIGYFLKTPPTMPFDGFVIGLPLVIGAIAGFWLGLKKEGRWFPTVLGGGSLAFTLTLFAFGTVLVDRYRHTEDLFSRLEPVNNSKSALASYRSFCSTWVFYAKRPIFEIDTSLVQSKTPINRSTDSQEKKVFQREKYWQPKVKPSINQFLMKFPDGQILVASNDWPELKSRLPSHYSILGKVPFYREELFQGKDRELFLIGPKK